MEQGITLFKQETWHKYWLNYRLIMACLSILNQSICCRHLFGNIIWLYLVPFQFLQQFSKVWTLILHLVRFCIGFWWGRIHEHRFTYIHYVRAVSLCKNTHADWYLKVKYLIHIIYHPSTNSVKCQWFKKTPSLIGR